MCGFLLHLNMSFTWNYTYNALLTREIAPDDLIINKSFSPWSFAFDTQFPKYIRKITKTANKDPCNLSNGGQRIICTKKKERNKLEKILAERHPKTCVQQWVSNFHDKRTVKDLFENSLKHRVTRTRLILLPRHTDNEQIPSTLLNFDCII